MILSLTAVTYFSVCCKPGLVLPRSQSITSRGHVGIGRSPYVIASTIPEAKWLQAHQLFPQKPFSQEIRTQSALNAARTCSFTIQPTTCGTQSRSLLSDVKRYLDLSQADEESHFHLEPPEYTGRPASAIRCQSSWRDLIESNRVDVKWAVVAFHLDSNRTASQIEGVFNKAWQPSHLCGCSTCCNWWHLKSGLANVSDIQLTMQVSSQPTMYERRGEKSATRTREMS